MVKNHQIPVQLSISSSIWDKFKKMCVSNDEIPSRVISKFMEDYNNRYKK